MKMGQLSSQYYHICCDSKSKHFISCYPSHAAVVEVAAKSNNVELSKHSNDNECSMREETDSCTEFCSNAGSYGLQG